MIRPGKQVQHVVQVGVKQQGGRLLICHPLPVSSRVARGGLLRGHPGHGGCGRRGRRHSLPGSGWEGGSWVHAGGQGEAQVHASGAGAGGADSG